MRALADLSTWLAGLPADAHTHIHTPKESAMSHPATCGPYCAKTHCPCGRDAAHGSKKCGVCR